MSAGQAVGLKRDPEGEQCASMLFNQCRHWNTPGLSDRVGYVGATSAYRITAYWGDIQKLLCELSDTKRETP